MSMQPLYNHPMKQSLDRFIMKVPYPLFKKVLYIYVGAVIFWDNAPFASMVLWGVILATLLIIGYQSRVRIADAIQKHSSSDDIYSEAMRGPITYWGPRLFVVSIASALTGYFLDGQFGLKGVQIFFLIMGYAVFYRETNLLGAFVNYIITDRGIGIYYVPGHNVYQLFINFSEIKSITVVKDNNSPSPLWTCLSPYDAKTGLLLSPVSPDGFLSRDKFFFITPKNMDVFISHLPPIVKVSGQ